MNYKKIGVGILAVVILASAFYFYFGDDAEIKFTDDYTKFYIYDGDKRILVGTEYNKLYDGSKTVYRYASEVDRWLDNSSDHYAYAYRHTPYRRVGCNITDVYKFSKLSCDITQFPVYHKLIFEGCKDLFYRYQVEDLKKEILKTDYKVTSPQLFDYNMKVEWQDGNRWAHLYKNNKLKVQYKIPEDYYEINVKLFDPPTKDGLVKTKNGYRYIFNDVWVDFELTRPNERIKEINNTKTLEPTIISKQMFPSYELVINKTNKKTVYGLEFSEQVKDVYYKITSNSDLTKTGDYSFKVFTYYDSDKPMKDTRFTTIRNGTIIKDEIRKAGTVGTKYNHYKEFDFSNVLKKNDDAYIELTDDFIFKEFNILDHDPVIVDDTDADWDVGTFTNMENVSNELRAERDAVLIMNFDVDNSYDQNEYVKDSSSYGNDGVTTTPSLCTSGDCFSFDGVDDYINILDSTSLNPSSITVGIWIKPASLNSINLILSKGSSGDNLVDYELRLISGRPSFRFYDGSAWRAVTSTSAISIGSWYHIMGTHNGTDMKIYINGQLKQTASQIYALPNSTGDLRIGVYSLSLASFFKGDIASVSIYNKTLSLNEILALNNSGKSFVNTSDNDLVAGYVLNSSYFAQSLTDLSGNNNDGSMGAWYNSSGVHGGAAQFDGISGSYVKIDGFELSNESGSVMGWFNWASLDSGTYGGVTLGQDSGSGVVNRVMQWGTMSGKISCYTNDGTSLISSITPTLGQWYHILETWNGANHSLYVDGVLEDSELQYPDVGSTQDIFIGTLHATHPTLFNGSADDIRILPRVLTHAQILEYYNGSKSSYSDAGYMPVYKNNGNYTSGIFDTNYGSLWLNSTTLGMYSDSTTMEFNVGNVTTGSQLLADGSMEAVSTSAWSSLYNAILTKETNNPHSGSKLLRIQKGDANALARQDITIGKTYRVTGWVRGDGTSFVNTGNGGTDYFIGTPGSTEWEHFDYTSTAGYSYVYFIVTGGTTGNYIEIDDIRVVEVIDSGLVLAWALNDTVFEDLSGNDNNGTASGTQLVNATFGNQGSTYFNGNDDVVTVTGVNENLGNTTICLWSLCSNNGAATGRILQARSSSASEYELIRTNDCDSFYVKVNGNNAYVETGDFSGGWEHSCITYTGSGGNVFINGEKKPVAISNQGATATISNIYLGNDYTQSLSYGGYIRNVKLYNRSLSASDILEEYRQSSGQYINMSFRTSDDNSTWTDYSYLGIPDLRTSDIIMNTPGKFVQYKLEFLNNYFFSPKISNQSFTYSSGGDCYNPYSPREWYVNMSTDCSTVENVNVTGYNVTFVETGSITTNHSVYIDEFNNISSGQTINLKSDAVIYVGQT